MIEQDWIGPGRQARLLAHIAAAVRNGPLKGPSGDGSVWTADDFISSSRWEPHRPFSLKELKRQLRSMFGKKR